MFAGGSLPPLDSCRHPYEDILGVRELEEAMGKEAESFRQADRQLHEIELSMLAEDDDEREEIRSATSAGPSVQDLEVGYSEVIQPDGQIYRGWHQEITFINHVLHARRKVNSEFSTITANLHTWPTDRIGSFLKRLILFHMLITLTSIVVCSIELSKVFNGTQIVVHEMWSAILILFTASFVEVINLSGYYAVKYENRLLLLVYITSLTIMVLLLLSMSFVAFIYATEVHIEVLDELNADSSAAVHSLWEYNIVLGASCIAVFIVALVPLVTSYMYERRMRSEAMYLRNETSLRRGEAFNEEADLETLEKKAKQLRVVLKSSTYVSVAAAAAMLIYGAHSLHYLHKLKFAFTFMEVFGLIYGGVLIFLVGIAGQWTAVTSQIGVIQFLQYIALPVLVSVMIYAAQRCFILLPVIHARVSEALDSNLIILHGQSTPAEVQFIVMSQLIVTGMVCIFVVFVQLISFIASRQLLDTMKTQYEKKHELSTNRTASPFHAVHSDDEIHTKLSLYERLLVTWGFSAGLYSIFFNGTYVIFSTWSASKEVPQEVSVAWDKLGEYDARYIESDGYLVVSSGVLALVAGPLALLYAGTTVEKRISR